MNQDHTETTELLHQWRSGNVEAFEKLIERVYDELKKLAHHKLVDEFHGSGLRTTELLNEACILLMGKRDLDWKSRNHFMHTAGLAMYRFLVDESRRRKSLAQGGHVVKVPFEEAVGWVDLDNDTILALEKALDDLGQEDDALVNVVKLRFFAGFSIRETAEILNMPTITVNRKWRFAKALLKTKLDKPSPGASS